MARTARTWAGTRQTGRTSIPMRTSATEGTSATDRTSATHRAEAVDRADAAGGAGPPNGAGPMPGRPRSPVGVSPTGPGSWRGGCPGPRFSPVPPGGNGGGPPLPGGPPPPPPPPPSFCGARGGGAASGAAPHPPRSVRVLAAVAGEGGRIGFLPREQDFSGGIAAEPHSVAVGQSHGGPRQHPVTVDKRPVRGVLVADCRAARVVDGDRSVAPRDVLELGEGRGDQRFRWVTAEQQGGSGGHLAVARPKRDPQHRGGDRACRFLAPQVLLHDGGRCRRVLLPPPPGPAGPPPEADEGVPPCPRL